MIACGPPEEAAEPLSVVLQSGSVRLRELGPAEVRARPRTAWGKPGDYALDNGLVEFVLSTGDAADGYVGMPGGVLDAFVLDELGHAGFDSLDELWPLINGAPIRSQGQEVREANDVLDGAEAIEVRFSGALEAIPFVFALADAEAEIVPVQATVTYSLSAGSRALAIVTQVTNVGDAPVRLEVGDFAIFGNDAAEMFTLPAGFDHGSELSSIEAIGSAAEDEPWAALSFAREPLELVRGSSVADQLGPGNTGVIRHTVHTVELAPGEGTSVERFLALGRDVADAALEYHRRRAQPTVNVSGRVSSLDVGVPFARVSFFEDEAYTRFVARATTDREGRYSAELPPGTYFARAAGRGNGERVHVPGLSPGVAEGFEAPSLRLITLPVEPDATLDFELEPAGQLTVSVLDAQGAPTAAKLTFERETPLPAPLLAAGERQPYGDRGIAQVHWTAEGSLVANLPPGRYDITASRGPRYELARAQAVPVDTNGNTLTLQFQAPIGPDGYVALDSHLHGPESGHGEVTAPERLITALAEGLDVVVTTDHDAIVDDSKLARALGIDHALLTIPGVELTYSSCHQNLWPLVPDAAHPNGGGTRWWLADPGLEALHSVYAAQGARIVQLNHGAGYFRAWGYDPATGQGRPGERFSPVLDAMELHNGKGSGGRKQLIPRWFSLLNWGHRVAPLAVSDSHARIPEPGSGRTYVWLDGAAPSADRVASAVLASRTVASTGPWIDLRLPNGEVALGRDVHAAPGEAIELMLQVWAPSWAPIEEVRLIANGAEIQRWNATSAPPIASPAPTDGLWLEQTLRLEPSSDTWYAIEAVGSQDLSPVYPGLAPWAMTAPVFIDADGTPGFTPPCHIRACP